jgi:hypothetical protein
VADPATASESEPASVTVSDTATDSEPESMPASITEADSAIASEPDSEAVPGPQPIRPGRGRGWTWQLRCDLLCGRPTPTLEYL